MEGNFETIALSNIDREDKSFVITAVAEDPQIRGSVEHVGVINPPLLAWRESARSYCIVCGFRRITALVSCGAEKVQARVCPPEVGDRRLLELSLHDNLSHRQLNLLELSLIHI